MAGRARVGQGCLSDKQGREGAVTLAFPSRYLLAAQGRGRGRAGGSSVFGNLEFAFRVSKTQKDLGNFWIWFSGHGFQDLGSQLWSLGNFRIWFSRHGF